MSSGRTSRIELVHLRLNRAGRPAGRLRSPSSLRSERAELKAYLDGLSTLGRFLRFAQDFRRAGRLIACSTKRSWWAASLSCVLRLEDACEFLSKKDYTDNWQSEMHERFCFWSFAEWRRAVLEAGFR